MDIHSEWVVHLRELVSGLNKRNQHTSLWLKELVALNREGKDFKPLGSPEENIVEDVDYEFFYRLVVSACFPIFRGEAQHKSVTEIACNIGAKIRRANRDKIKRIRRNRIVSLKKTIRKESDFIREQLDMVRANPSYKPKATKKIKTCQKTRRHRAMRELKKELSGASPEAVYCLHGGMLLINALRMTRAIECEIRKKDKKDKYPSYFIKVENEELFSTVINREIIDLAEEGPYNHPLEDWTGGIHPRERTIVRRADAQRVAERFGPEQHMTYTALNKLQNVGYTIDAEALEVYLKCLKLPDNESPFKYAKEGNPTAKASMIREAEVIGKMATHRVLDKDNMPFYHDYSCDFRGRIYPGTAYLHEQSSDNAKGLIRYDNKVPIGRWGVYFLAIHTANSMGNDKIPLNDRVSWILDEQMDNLLAWARDPMGDRGWMKADKAWSTLACALEWLRIDYHCSIEGNIANDYESNLPIFIDGSCNGLQHLTALASDETTAPLVNLNVTLQDDVPGDIYMHVANHVWRNLSELEVGEENLNELIKQVVDLRRAYEESKGVSREARDKAFNTMHEFEKANKEVLKVIWPDYWSRHYDKRRKIVKRPVMTLAYGVTLAGVRDQLHDDTQDNMGDELRYKMPWWSNKFGDLVYRSCREALPGPSSMLTLFEEIATQFNQRNESMRWNTPITNFPVVQEYSSPDKKRALYDLLPLTKRHKTKTVECVLYIFENSKLKKKDQITGASPNVIHSLDATHLTMVVNEMAEAGLDCTMVHDSFGSHIGNMNTLRDFTRGCFVELYESDPLIELLTQWNALEKLNEIDRGNLDVRDTLQSDFAFA